MGGVQSDTPSLFSLLYPRESIPFQENCIFMGKGSDYDEFHESPIPPVVVVAEDRGGDLLWRAVRGESLLIGGEGGGRKVGGRMRDRRRSSTGGTAGLPAFGNG